MYLLETLVRLSRVCLVMILAVSITPVHDLDAEQLTAELSTDACGAGITPVDHGRVLEELDHAYAWNRLLAGSSLAAIDDGYFSTEEVLRRVDSWSPLIACIAYEFDIPPELLAGTMALEIDLDYHLADALFDDLIRSPWGRTFSVIEIGAGYAGVHFRHLRPALTMFGTGFAWSPFYWDYYRLIMNRSDADLTLLATRYPVIDLADAAVMARYYALLRLGKRPASTLTLDDMAFVWSAYRGGVAGSVADPSKKSRWSLDALQKADNPHLFGDTIIALPYFSYYHTRFHAANADRP